MPEKPPEYGVSYTVTAETEEPKKLYDKGRQDEHKNIAHYFLLVDMPEIARGKFPTHFDADDKGKIILELIQNFFKALKDEGWDYLDETGETGVNEKLTEEIKTCLENWKAIIPDLLQENYMQIGVMHAKQKKAFLEKKYRETGKAAFSEMAKAVENHEFTPDMSQKTQEADFYTGLTPEEKKHLRPYY